VSGPRVLTQKHLAWLVAGQEYQTAHGAPPPCYDDRVNTILRSIALNRLQLPARADAYIRSRIATAQGIIDRANGAGSRSERLVPLYYQLKPADFECTIRIVNNESDRRACTMFIGSCSLVTVGLGFRV
jgi:hypothetical protein